MNHTTESTRTVAEPALGNRRLLGQHDVRHHLQEAASSGSVPHAWLFSGPPGSGTTAIALAFAEWLQGIDHLSNFEGAATSRKSSWFTHPDIHVFLPLTSAISESASSTAQTLKERREVLAEDPYNIADLRRRPSLTEEGKQNLRPFYAIKYMNEVIRRKSQHKPAEGPWAISILTDVDTLNKTSANAFLKLLEEPPPNHLFLLTTHNPGDLLPTILSRCQQIRLGSLTPDEVERGLVEHDGMDAGSARFLARASYGNYEEARTVDPDEVRTIQQEQIRFFRACWTQDAPLLHKMIGGWHTKKNREGHLLLCRSMQRLIRDILVQRETQSAELLAHPEQQETIARMTENLPDARFEEIFRQLDEAQTLLARNVQFKLLFTTLAIRFGYLLRGEDSPIPERKAWHHLPALVQSESESSRL
ncbi:MAG: ATP-binding protein [Bacteroidota bacterium]